MVAKFNFSFDEACASNWYKALPTTEKDKFKSFVQKANNALSYARTNGLPQHYVGVANKILKQQKLNADPGVLTDEQVYAIDSTIVKTMYAQNIWGQIFGSVRSAGQAGVWDQKIYKLDEDKVYPQLDKSFQNPPTFTLGVEPSKQSGWGCAIAYEIPWTDIIASKGGLYQPDYYYPMVAAERMGILQDEFGWHGSNAPHNFSGDFGYKGIVNHGSVQSYTHATSATLWNNWKGMLSGASKFKTVYQNHKLVWVLTSGLASDLYYQMTTTGNIDLEISLFKKYAKDIVDEIWVTDRIYSAGAGTTIAVANTAQVGVMIGIGPQLQRAIDVFPTQTKPMANKTYPDDIKEAIIYGQNLVQYPVATFPVAVASAITSTDTGFVKPGRLM